MDLLKQVNDEHAFVLKNGKILNSLADFKTHIHSLDKDIFEHHVNDERNDFANWIRHVHKDNKLADSIGKAKSQQEIADAISDRVKELTTPKKNEPDSKIVHKSVEPQKHIVITLGENKSKDKVTIKMIKPSSKKAEKYPLHMLAPKASIRDNFMPFLKKDEIDYDKYKFSDKPIKQKHEKKHPCDGVSNKDYMRAGAYDFFKGVLFGIIVGALLTLAVL